jgi:hypothetical protein
MQKLLSSSVPAIQHMLLTYQSLFPHLAGVPTFLYDLIPCPAALMTVNLMNSRPLLEGKGGAR